MKNCSKCLTNKSLSEFYIRSGKHLSWCKTCTLSYHKKWRQINSDRYKKTNQKAWKKYYYTHHERVLKLMKIRATRYLQKKHEQTIS